MNQYAIVLAADLPDPQAVADLINRVGHIVDGVKIGLTTVLQAGVGFIEEITESAAGKPILLDLKIGDIGHRTSAGWEGTNGKILRCLRNSGVTHVTVHGFPGPASMAEAISVAHDTGIRVLALPFMSHAGADLFFSQPISPADVISKSREMGLEISPTTKGDPMNIGDAILAFGEALDVDGYIGPATNPKVLERIRAITTRPVWCPGFGRQDRLGRDLKTQFRDWAGIVGPASAAIVGSLIFASPDPLAQAINIKETRDKVVDSLVP